MPDVPKYFKFQIGEEVIRKSKGIGISAILWFDEDGKIYTKKPCNGDAYLTNQRLIFEGHEIASAWQNMAYNVYWPSSFFLAPGPLNIVIFLKNVVDVSKTNQIRAEPIKLTHNQNDTPNPLYFSFNDKDEWITDIEDFMRQNQFSAVSSTQPPPPPDFQPPSCPTCAEPLSYIQQYQRWYCNKDKKYI
jgi:hypothetical protein